MSALYGTYARSELAFERGEGMRLYDQHGRSYLDFHSSVAVNALGHGDARRTEYAERTGGSTEISSIHHLNLALS